MSLLLTLPHSRCAPNRLTTLVIRKSRAGRTSSQRHKTPNMDSLLPALLTLTLVQWALYILFLEPESSSTIMSSRARTAQDQYVRAVARCRAEKKFFFLDLPVECRRQIYTYLFSDPIFVVCSFTKDRSLAASAPWPDNALAQILSTRKTIYKEAWRHLYSNTNWHFPSASSLLYFTWFDVSASKLGLVRSITITGLPALEEGFVKVSQRLSGLVSLFIDTGLIVYRKKPLHDHQHEEFIRRITATPFYVQHVLPHTLGVVPRNCNVFAVVQVVCELTSEERTREVSPSTVSPALGGVLCSDNSSTDGSNQHGPEEGHSQLPSSHSA